MMGNSPGLQAGLRVPRLMVATYRTSLSRTRKGLGRWWHHPRKGGILPWHLANGRGGQTKEPLERASSLPLHSSRAGGGLGGVRAWREPVQAAVRALDVNKINIQMFPG